MPVIGKYSSIDLTQLAVQILATKYRNVPFSVIKQLQYKLKEGFWFCFCFLLLTPQILLQRKFLQVSALPLFP